MKFHSNLSFVKNPCCSVSLIRVTYCLKGGEPYQEENDVDVLRQKLIEGYRLEKPAHCSEEA